MSRLRVLTEAPAINLPDALGNAFALERMRGKQVVLVFLRHLGCPVCRMEIAQWMKRTPDFHDQGAEVVLFVDSPAESVRAFVQQKKPPFILLPDPERHAYRAYGVERGTLGQFLAPGAAIKSVRAMLKGHMHGRFEGSELQLPADFVINADGTVKFASYGAHIADNTPIDQLYAIISGQPVPSSGRGSVSRRTFLIAGAGGAAAIGAAGAGGAKYFTYRVEHVPEYPADRVRELYNGESNLLLERFAGLRGKLPWMPLGTFPTPVELLPSPDGAKCALWVKRDDLNADLYGGNKVRKLEHVLADAKLTGATSLLTVGGIGSNQCLATALYGRKHGFKVDIALFDQPVSEHVKSNLRGNLAAGANFVYGGGFVSTAVRGKMAYRQRMADGYRPYYIPAGATTPLGNSGYVTAVLELAEQVKAGLMPEPSRIFVAAGSGGTIAGLIAGCKIAGLKTRCVGVQITEKIVVNKPRIRRLAQDLIDLLRRFDPQVPDIRISVDDFAIDGSHFGGGYGVPTDAGLHAIEWARPHVKLDPTYTAKAMAACMDYCRGAHPGETVLYWHTLNSREFPQAESLDGLPDPLRKVFAG